MFCYWFLITIKLLNTKKKSRCQSHNEGMRLVKTGMGVSLGWHVYCEEGRNVTRVSNDDLAGFPTSTINHAGAWMMSPNT